jgi:murein DD-endopeptidase MepM/ murein hydrolase activator NlpD
MADAPNTIITQPAGSNPVSQPYAPTAPSSAPSSQGALNSQGLTAQQMGQRAEAEAAARRAPGVTASIQTAPPPVQGPEAPGSRIEAHTTTPGSAPQVAEVARLNGISLEEASQRIARANASASGQVYTPPGTVYDPATGKYSDQRTKLYLSSLDPNMAMVFTANEREAIDTMYKTQADGITTTAPIRQGAASLNSAITRAEATPLPLSTANLGTQGLSSATGSIWETALPPEYQLLLDTVRANNERLASGQDPTSLLLKDLRDRMDSRERAEITSIQDKADTARKDQEVANKRALSRAKIFFASMGSTGSSQELQYVADTISGGERALRDIANAERDAIQQARNAFEDKNFDLALKQVDLAESRRKEYQDGLKSVIELKNSFEQMAMQKLQFQKQMQAMDFDLREKQQKSVQDTMKLMLESGASPEDIPEATYDAWGASMGVNGTAARNLMRTAQAAKAAADTASLVAVVKDATALAKDLPVGTDIDIPLPNGESMTISGRYVEGSEDFQSSTVTLGNNQYGPVGQYIITRDKMGNVVNATYVGEHYVAPYFDQNTGEWKTYNPTDNTTTTLLNNGQYGEGTTGVHNATSYVNDVLVPQFGEPTQGPYDSFSHDNLMAWDFSMPKGTPVKVPTGVSGRVVAIYNDSNTYTPQNNPGGMAAYGNAVDIQNMNSGEIYRLAHFSQFAPGLEIGMGVSSGQIVGLAGSTGLSTGNHLHLEVRDANNKAIAPKNATVPYSPTPRGAQTDVVTQYNQAHPGAALNPKDRRDRETASQWVDDQKKEKDKTMAPPKLSAAQVTEMSGYDSSLALIQDIKPLLKSVNTGPVSARLLRARASAGFFADSDAVALDSKLSTLKAEYMKAISGAAVSEAEATRLMKLLPDLTDDDKVLNTKISQLESYIRTRKMSILQNVGQGGIVVMASPSGEQYQFDLSDPQQREEYNQAVANGYNEMK